MIQKDLFTKYPVWIFWFFARGDEMDIAVRVWYWEITSPFNSRINTFLFDQLYS